MRLWYLCHPVALYNKQWSTRLCGYARSKNSYAGSDSRTKVKPISCIAYCFRQICVIKKSIDSLCCSIYKSDLNFSGSQLPERSLSECCYLLEGPHITLSSKWWFSLSHSIVGCISINTKK